MQNGHGEDNEGGSDRGTDQDGAESTDQELDGACVDHGPTSQLTYELGWEKPWRVWTTGERHLEYPGPPDRKEHVEGYLPEYEHETTMADASSEDAEPAAPPPVRGAMATPRIGRPLAMRTPAVGAARVDRPQAAVDGGPPGKGPVATRGACNLGLSGSV
jgi:hypothetical protein